MGPLSSSGEKSNTAGSKTATTHTGTSGSKASTAFGMGPTSTLGGAEQFPQPQPPPNQLRFSYVDVSLVVGGVGAGQAGRAPHLRALAGRRQIVEGPSDTMDATHSFEDFDGQV